LDPLIKRDPHSLSTENHDDVKLEDLYTTENQRALPVFWKRP